MNTSIITCRLCLNQSSTKFSLFKNGLDTMLEALTSIKVGPKDQLDKICLKCNLNLKLAYRIQQNILKADEKLRNGHLDTSSIQDNCVIKIEEITIEDNDLEIDTAESIHTCTEDSVTTHIQHHFNHTQSCNLCNQTFTDSHSYTQHLTDHHSTEDGLRDVRARKPNRPTAAEAFLLKIYKKDQFACTKCPEKFSTRLQLMCHGRAHAPKGLRKTCPVCKKSITAPNFSKHVQTHTSGPQMCHECGKTCANVEALRMHAYKHRNLRYECKECGATFSSRQNMNGHRKRHHSEAEQVCDLCGRRFFFAYQLSTHVRRTHMKERPYVCEFCDRAFSGRNAMITHRRRHTKETPYRCEVCGEGFRQRVSLKGHLRSKHDIVEEITTHCEVCGKGFASVHALKSHMRYH